MTIKRGAPWGTAGPLPDDGVVVTTDAEASDVVRMARQRGADVPVLGLAGGDLCRTMGGTGDRERLRSPDAVTFPLDLGLVSHDGDDAEFVAHVVARDRWWRRVLVAMNAQWIGSWNAGPRAHPNDGLLDVYDAALTLRELPAVRRRLVSGTHVPHPHIDHRRVRELNVSFDRGRWLFIDGRPAGRVRQLRIGIEPDRLRAVV